MSQVSVTVTAPSGTGTLTATPSVLAGGLGGGGLHRVTLNWSGLAGATVDVIRNGVRVATPSNTGTRVDYPGSSAPTSVTYTYKVCSSGTNTCTNTVSVSFGTGNTAPTVNISSPANGASFVQGATISLTATASDTQDGTLTGQIQWTDNGTPVGSGGTVSRTLTTLGAHVIVATVTDTGSLPGSSQVSITVTAPANTPPTVTITSPANGASFVQGTTISLTATASDTQDGTLTGQIQWTDNGTPVGSGGTVSRTLTTLGAHVIVATVTDTGSLPGSSQVSITVTAPANTPPTVTITSPANGASFVQGTTISLTATASDTQDGTLTGQIQWTDNGTPVGSGGTVSRTLTTLGAHVIVATVTDTGGLPGSSQVSITVTAPANTPPTVTITSPANGASFEQGTVISFTATAADTQDGNLTAQIQWTDNGTPVGSGGSVSRTLTTLGAHVIVATVTDSGGLPGLSQVSVTVTAPPNTPPTVSISSPANGASFVQNTVVSLTASASDAQDGTLTGQIQWTDNGIPVGSGGSVSRTLTTLGAHVIVATVTDSGGLPGSSQVSVTVTAPSGTGTLTATPSVLAGGLGGGGGLHRVTLNWSGLAGATVDVIRNGVRVATPSNTGTRVDYPGSSAPTSVTYTYKVCSAGTDTCTNTVSVSF